MDGATTIVESPKKGAKPNPPILVICPDPPFKPSYFKKHNLVDPGIEKYFWYFYNHYISKLENDSTPLDIYMNMSLKLGVGWNIFGINKDFSKDIVLKIGKNDYFGKEVYLEEVRTFHCGLCYKLKLSSKDIIPVIRGVETSFTFRIQCKENGREKLPKVSLMLAANNTWQGISFGNWPYSKNPPVIYGNLKENVIEIINIKLEENVWMYQNGQDGFIECLKMENNPNCTSIFDPFPSEFRYQSYQFSH